MLSICSGIFGLNEGVGPPGEALDYKTYAKTMDASITGSANPTTILLGTDPIAVEMLTIKMMRLNKSGKYGTDDMPPYLQASAGISGKMFGATCHIGIINESDMDIQRVINDVTLVAEFTRTSKWQPELHISSPGRSSTLIEFSLPYRVPQKFATALFFSLDGSLVTRNKIAIKGVRNHVSWNHRNAKGDIVKKGRYLATIVCGKTRLSRIFTII